MDNYEIKVYDNKEEIVAVIRNRWLKFRVDPRSLEYRGFRLSKFDKRFNAMYYFDSVELNNSLGIHQYETDFSAIADKIIEVINETKVKIDEYILMNKRSVETKKVPIFKRFKL